MIGTSDSIKNKKFNNNQGTETLEKLLLTITFVHFYLTTIERTDECNITKNGMTNISTRNSNTVYNILN